MDDFRAWTTLAIAVVALVQPVAIWAWSRYFRQGNIDVYETGNIEIGFIGAGPTIALQGTLRAIHQDQFVTQIQLQLVRIADRAEHLFDWLVFRAPQSSVGGTPAIEVAAGFMLPTSSPRRYNIQFVDRNAQRELQQLSNNLQDSWREVHTREGLSPFAQTPEYQAKYDAVFTDFSRTRSFLEPYGAIQRACYWEPGKYRLTAIVQTARPEARFSKTWHFELSTQGCERLRLNALEIAQTPCGKATGYYNWEYPQYAFE